MKSLILVFAFLAQFFTAQNIPDCIQKLNKKNDLVTTQFVKIIVLNDNRKVYEFSVKSVRRCMDCPNGKIYYDENCKLVGDFTIGLRVNKYIAPGYTAGDFSAVKPPDKNIKKAENYENKILVIYRVMLYDFNVFKTGDTITFSRQQGLKHYRNNELVNTYKIIPKKVSSPEAHLPRIYYLEPFQRYFKVVDNQLWVTKTKFETEKSSIKINDDDWFSAVDITKKENEKK